jgi:hypothetical protein
MKREFVYLKDIEEYDDIHKLVDGKLQVNKKRDGKSTEEHLKEIDYFTKLLKDGVKLIPVLLKKDKKFIKLDGFKRIQAHKKAGCKVIEAFICEKEDMGKSFNYDGKELICKRGGQSYKRFNKIVEYGEPINQENSDGKINFLYRGKSIRLEYRENIHLHFGKRKEFRIALGRKDFNILSEAFEKWEKQ